MWIFLREMVSKKAIYYMIISAFCFTGINSVIRYVDHLPTFELVFFRAIGSAICCFIILYRYKIPPLGTQQKLLVARGVIGMISMALFYKALQVMPMASAVSLRYLSPFFAAVFAILYLKERMVNIQWVFYVTAFVGVVLLKGFDTRITFFGLIIILTSSIFSGMIYVIIRKIGKSEHPIVVINYFMVISAVIGGIVSLFNWVQPVGIQWLYLCLMGLFGFIAQYFMTMALQMEEANLVTPFKYSEVIFTLIAGWVLFGEHQSIFAIGAMTLIIISLLANVLVNQRSRNTVTK